MYKISDKIHLLGATVHWDTA